MGTGKYSGLDAAGYAGAPARWCAGCEPGHLCWLSEVVEGLWWKWAWWVERSQRPETKVRNGNSEFKSLWLAWEHQNDRLSWSFQNSPKPLSSWFIHLREALRHNTTPKERMSTALTSCNVRKLPASREICWAWGTLHLHAVQPRAPLLGHLHQGWRPTCWWSSWISSG